MIHSFFIFVIHRRSIHSIDMSASDGKSPADFLKAIKGKTVLVKLNSGVDYRGARATTPTRMFRFDSMACVERLTTTASFSFDDAGVLACLDGYMNIAMEQTEVRTFVSATVARDIANDGTDEDHSFIHSFETR